MRTLALHESSRYRAAADYARRIYPGLLGELICRELERAVELGYRDHRDALVPRLVDDILHRPTAVSRASLP
ncbi:hypothetical protein LQ327_09910 [Actinomycetospora endophytica]|uniref:Uncharacterized protein n=1 Tax=Actinomycetospora endophytica TaxID=2291215 RepID=A0ABS8P610_9PSEU|nr:hypothetical protein [Actinomycetospora endophytica]MCD2193690.1 hypothetical protein [Actinomycetospora endophytica]